METTAMSNGGISLNGLNNHSSHNNNNNNNTGDNNRMNNSNYSTNEGAAAAPAYLESDLTIERNSYQMTTLITRRPPIPSNLPLSPPPSNNPPLATTTTNPTAPPAVFEIMDNNHHHHLNSSHHHQNGTGGGGGGGGGAAYGAKNGLVTVAVSSTTTRNGFNNHHSITPDTPLPPSPPPPPNPTSIPTGADNHKSHHNNATNGLDKDSRDVQFDDENDEEVIKFLSRVEGRSPTAIKSAMKYVMKPSKSQVLCYLSAASSLRVKRVGGELQVTDMEDFPLLDVWVEMDCCRCTWVVEAYGRVVLLLHEQPSFAVGGCRSGRPPISITDWNGDLFGYLIPGDPFLLQSPERQTIAKLVPHSSSSNNNSLSSNNLIPNSAPSYSDLPQSLDATAGTSSTTNPVTSRLGNGVPGGVGGGAASGEKSLCWLCVLEGSGRHIARLQDFDALMFNKEVAFQLKLLTLAGIIRLSGPWMMPGRGESRHTMGTFSRLISAFLNCCAYCFY